MKLTQEQIRIVEHGGGHARVSAVAGSGKTTTMVARIGHLLTQGVSAGHILILMFNRSARDGFETSMTQALHHLGRELPEVRTFHSFGLRLTQSFTRKGMLPNYRLVTEDYVLERMARKAANEAYRDSQDEEGYLSSEDVEEFLTFIDQVKSTVRGPDKVFSEQDLSSRLRFFPQAFQLFEQQRKREKIRFFADLIHEPLIAMLDNDDLAAWVANRVEHIIVDEYQDINECQQQLLKIVTGNRAKVMVVGDVDQCIYEWRGAKPEYITKRFGHDFEKPVDYQLSYTFRYGHALSLAANHLIANNRKRDQKLCISHTSNPHTRLLWMEEGRGEPVLTAIKDWLERGRRLSEAVVLVRLFAQSVPVELALLEAGIAYRLEGGADVFDCIEIKALTGYLKLGCGLLEDDDLQDQEEQLLAMFTQPHLGVPREEVQQIAVSISGNIAGGTAVLESWCDADVPPFIKRRFREAAENWRWLNSCEPEAAAGPFLKQLVEKLGLYEFYHSFSARTATAENRVKTCEAFINFAASHNLSIAGLIHKTVELQREKSGGEDDVLLITSIHRAKGLEWPLVILPGLEEGSFPFYREQGQEDDLEDERRLFYVALTRGVEEVVCVHPPDALLKRNISRNRSKVPAGMLRASRFLYEANLGLSAGLGDSIAAENAAGELQADEVIVAEKYLNVLGVESRLVKKDESPETKKNPAGDQGRKEKNGPSYLGINDICEGLMVFHPAFGAGTVTAIKDRRQGRLTVAFEDHGEMVLLASYAKLELLASG